MKRKRHQQPKYEPFICVSEKYNSYIKFRPTVPKQIIRIIQQQKERKELHQSLYAFILGLNGFIKKECGFDKQVLRNILKNIEETATQTTYGCRWQEPIVYLKLRHIENICFRNLKRLMFNRCYLTNIEALAWLNIKKVQQICLDGNNIISLKPLCKTNLNELQKLYLTNNRIQHDSINYLQRLKCPKLYNLSLFLGVYRYQRQQLPDYLRQLRTIVKLQMDKTKKIKREQSQRGQLLIYCNYSEQNQHQMNVINHINGKSNFHLKCYRTYHYGSDDSKDPSEFVQDSQEDD